MSVAVLKLDEPVVRALVAQLNTNLPAVVTSINAENPGAADDGYSITCPAEANVLDYIPDPMTLSSKLSAQAPVVGVQDIESKLEDDQGAFATGVHRLGITVYVADADTRALAWRIRRYCRALASAAGANRLLAGGGGIGQEGAWGVVFERVLYGPTLEHEEDPRTWASWASVVIEARDDE